MIHAILIILFISLQVSDVVLTLLILRDGGRELNPVMRWLMDKMGTATALISAKLIIIALVIAFVDSLLLLSVFCAVYVAVIVFNARSVEVMK